MDLINFSKLMKWIKMKGFINTQSFKVFNIWGAGGGVEKKKIANIGSYEECDFTFQVDHMPIKL